MQCEFDFEGEVAITPPIAGDLWPQVVAICEDKQAADDGEAVFSVSGEFEGERGDTACLADVTGLRVDGAPCPAELASLFETQLVQQHYDTITEYLSDPGSYSRMTMRDRWASASRMARHRANVRNGEFGGAL